MQEHVMCCTELKNFVILCIAVNYSPELFSTVQSTVLYLITVHNSVVLHCISVPNGAKKVAQEPRASMTTSD